MSPPRKIGPFEIVKKLGSGTTASTYLAMERIGEAGARILVCLKVPHHTLVHDRQFVETLLREARIAAKLHHPSIVQLERVEHYEGLPCLVLDFIEGMDLAELIAAVNADGAQLDWLLVVHIAQAIARALEHAHEDQRGLGRAHERPPVIHRDLAPSNILLGLSGSAYVTDFGLARAMDRAWILASGQRGRIAYAAPEYLLGGRYDQRADLYSLGVILFEALTGRRPFPAVSMHQRNNHLEQVLRRARPSLHGLRFELHPSYGAPAPDGLLALARITDRLLEPDPAARFQTAAELVDELGAIHTPYTMDRVLREVVQRYQPAERRSIRTTTGEHPVSTGWGSTDFAPERDGIRVSAEGAARLIATFAHERERDIGTLTDSLAFEDHDLIELDSSLDATDPDRPAFDVPILDVPTIGGAADLLPLIPTTRPSHHVAAIGGAADFAPIIPITRPGHQPAISALGAGPAMHATASYVGAPPIALVSSKAQTPWAAASSAAPLQAEPPPASGTWIAMPSSVPQSPSFADTHYGLPVVDPATAPQPTSSALVFAGAAVLLALVSLFALSAASSLIAPLMTGQLGDHVVDPFWTPLCTYSGLVGFTLASMLGAVAIIVWWKNRAKRRGLPRR